MQGTAPKATVAYYTCLCESEERKETRGPCDLSSLICFILTFQKQNKKGRVDYTGLESLQRLRPRVPAFDGLFLFGANIWHL